MIGARYDPAYDNNGNMTKDEAGNTYSFDAWNRMISMDAAGTSFPAETYSYDADSRRPGLNICAGAIINSYYDTSWQDVEDDAYTPPNGCNPASTTVSTYDWSQSYIDDVVARDQSTNGGSITRIYAQQDANHDVTALVNTNGSVAQRYVYDPYGTATVLSPTWTGRSDQYSWAYTFQGGRWDSIAGSYNFRTRDYRPALGTWIERDGVGISTGGPLAPGQMNDLLLFANAHAAYAVARRLGPGAAAEWWLWQYADSANLYAFVGNDPSLYVDPTGTDRYVTGPFPHHGITVDNWAGGPGAWRRVGTITYDFSAVHDVRYILGFVVTAGQVTRTVNAPNNCFEYTIKSTPEEDRILIRQLDRRVKNPPLYNLFFYNCNHWTFANIWGGLRNQNENDVDRVQHLLGLAPIDPIRGG